MCETSFLHLNWAYVYASPAGGGTLAYFPVLSFASSDESSHTHQLITHSLINAIFDYLLKNQIKLAS